MKCNCCVCKKFGNKNIAHVLMYKGTPLVVCESESEAEEARERLGLPSFPTTSIEESWCGEVGTKGFEAWKDGYAEFEKGGSHEI